MPPTDPKSTKADGRDYETDLHAWGEACERAVNEGRTWAEKKRQELQSEQIPNDQ